MIAISKYKKLLGEEASGMNEEQIRQLRDAQYRFARMAFDQWKREQLGTIPAVENGA